jgi:hypothetical protein
VVAEGEEQRLYQRGGGRTWPVGDGGVARSDTGRGSLRQQKAARGFGARAAMRHSDTGGWNGMGGRRGFGHGDDAVGPTTSTRSARVAWWRGEHARDGPSRPARPINTRRVAG